MQLPNGSTGEADAIRDMEERGCSGHHKKNWKQTRHNPTIKKGPRGWGGQIDRRNNTTKGGGEQIAVPQTTREQVGSVWRDEKGGWG